MPEEIYDLKPGEYTALGYMNIRASMDTTINVNVDGAYTASSTFMVYEIFPEKKGIVWGRVSSNAFGSEVRYVALKVNNHFKAKLKRAFAETDQLPISLGWVNTVDAWLRAHGFTGPKPY